MAASGYTPISLYYSTTAGNAPSSGNLVDGELAINIADGLLYFKNSGGTVQNFSTFSGSASVLGTSASAADLKLYEDTDNGTNYLSLKAPAALAANVTLTFPDTDGDASQVLTTDGSGNLSWTTITPSDVVGPASATDNAIARYDGTTGKLIQNSAVTIDDTTGSMTFTGSAARILGDFSNSTIANRLIFQTSTTNGNTRMVVVPNGTATTSQFNLANAADPTNASTLYMQVSGASAFLSSGAYGSGSVLPLFIESTAGVTITAPSTKFTGAIDETVFAVSGTTPALSPSNGTIQTWTLSANSTPTAGTWNEGESMTMMIADGTAYTVTWTSVAVTWVGGTAPTLATTGYTVIELWKVGSTIYGAPVGDVA